MTAPLICPFAEIQRASQECAAQDLVGGKGLSLGLLTAAGLPVPPGFCLTTHAYRQAVRGGAEPELSRELREALAFACAQLGPGPVAVRSSATVEDGSAASFAGQQETILGVEGDQAIAEAVVRCWRSLHNERARAYRAAQHVDEAQAAMAVVVQRLVEAEVSGVLFTRDPLDLSGDKMLVESAWGLGEAIVSGRVMPDRFHLEFASGTVIEQEIHEQPIKITRYGEEEVPPEQRGEPSLTREQLAELAALGRRIEAYFGNPRDIEWAYADGKFWVLQARPITAATGAELEQVRREEIAALRARADARGTVWARYNLAEVLPHPTPMTWAVVRKFMSGQGGYGQMYRDLGFAPDPALDEEGFFDLICGRPYVNLSREPLLYFRDFPYGHDFAALKADPAKAVYPAPAADRTRLTARFWLRLPAILFHMLRNGARLKRMLGTEAARLRNEVFPEFLREVTAARAEDLRQLSGQQLIQWFDTWRRRTLVDFARHALRPSLLAAVALARLEQALASHVGPSRAKEAAQSLMTGVRPDAECDLARAVAELSLGKRSRQDFLAHFGHRGPSEMELSAPRWEESPHKLPVGVATGHSLSAEAPDESLQRAWEAGGVPAAARAALTPICTQAREYLALRESAKHHLMRGYALLRAALVELDRRHDLRGGVFYLLPEELPQLVAGADLRPLIVKRQKRYRLALAIPVPDVVYSDDVEALGRPAPVQAASQRRGTPVSAGVAEGTALVVTDPSLAPADAEGFILVCPSTDPAWAPLFLRARGLILETGGVLSHGAIVARELALPAVAGLPGVCRQLRSGQRVRVDGTSGVLHVLEE